MNDDSPQASCDRRHVAIFASVPRRPRLLRCHGSEADLRRLALDAYRAYRADRSKSGNPAVGWLRTLRDAGLRRLNKVLRRPSYDQAQRIGQKGWPDAIKIQFVGLWDTVDAYGLPVDELTRAIDRFVWPLTMRDCNLDERVLRARHALAIDDERNAFHPRLWNEKPDPKKSGIGVPGGNLATECIDEERISQVWFAGVHSNVGGGYPDDSLSYVPLQWMARVGTTGNDTYVLRGTPQTPPLQDRCGEVSRKSEEATGCDPTALRDGKPAEVFESTIVARSTGPLFLYVNDAVGWPLLDRRFYGNNRGCGRVEVSQIPPESPPSAS